MLGVTYRLGPSAAVNRPQGASTVDIVSAVDPAGGPYEGAGRLRERNVDRQRPEAADDLPYRLACLCDLRDEHGRVLLLRRNRPPNLGLASPIGGKLDVASGESPAECARREIREEAGLDLPMDRLHLLGLISECSYEGSGHWLLFFYRVIGPVRVRAGPILEGELLWVPEADLESQPLPETDRRIIWPLVRRHEARAAGQRHGFFAVHIDCRDGLRWTVQQSERPGG